MSDYETLFQSLKGMAEDLQSLNHQAVQEYTPVVESILHSQSSDTREIERTLDGLLGFCGYEPALALYKKLCRLYWDIDQAATAGYINAYREMWDSNDGEPSEGAADEPSGDDA